MENFANTGADLFCTTVRAAGWASLEMQTCGSVEARFVVGLATVAAIIVFAILGAWRLLEVR